MQQAFIGIDVGTGSARAGVFDDKGALLSVARSPIAIWHEAGGIVEQSSDDIWAACIDAVRMAMKEAAISPNVVRGIGFAATCSLVALDKEFHPLTISPSGESKRNVIVWMDHRAVAESQFINESADLVLQYVGGAISPEMQIPKLLWLKKNIPSSYYAAGQFFDLADYLSYRATGSLTRSICTLSCKWNYLSHERRWSREYFAQIGLIDLLEEDSKKIGSQIAEIGEPLGQGLTEFAAEAFGLPKGISVGASLIDAHAGGVGMIGGRMQAGDQQDICSRLAYIMGTSACIMASTREPCFVSGVWGPYYSAMIPGLWLNEGGQSAAGAAIDHLIRSHPAYQEAQSRAKKERLDIPGFLERRILSRNFDAGQAALLADNYHVLPDFLGNRSPYADPHSRAILAGLDLDESLESLERLFVAGLCGLAYGLADVVDAFTHHGITNNLIIVGGGAGRSPLVRQIMADTVGIPVALPQCSEPVLLGAAMLGARAAKPELSMVEIMKDMSSIGSINSPTPMIVFHKTKRRIYKKMQQWDREIRTEMEGRGRKCY